MSRAAVAVAAALVAACEGEVVLAPAIQVPAVGSDADPFIDLDELELSLAFDGEDDVLALASFSRGSAVELFEVPYGEDLVVHLVGRFGGTAVAYGRTCSFDLQPDVTPPAPPLWFSRTVKWADLAPPVAADRRGGVALAAADGAAIFLGGVDSAGTEIETVERFDPRGDGFAELARLAPRARVTFAPLGDGRILGIGGIDRATGTPAPYVEVIAPPPALGNRVEVLDDDRAALVAPAAATLADGSVVVIGGEELAGDVLVASGRVLVLRVADGGLELRQILATLATPRADHTVTRLSDDLGAPLLVAGGRDASGAVVAVAELYKPLREEFAAAAAFAPALVVPRRRHVAVRMPDGSVLIAGGVDGSGAAVRTLELFSLDGGFVEVGQLPEGAGVVDLSATVLPDGRVLLAGGRDGLDGAPVDVALIARLDPLDGSVDLLATDRLALPRAGHQSVQLCDGTILLVGGADGDAPAERYAPPSTGRR